MNTKKKTVKNLLKGNICAALFCIITPEIIYLLLKAAELIIRRFFFPYYISDVKEAAILCFELLLQIVLLYPLRFSRKFCFYDNCQTKKIRLSGVFFCFSSFKAFILSSTAILLKYIIKLLFILIFIVPSFWLLRLTFSANYAVYYQIGSALLLAAVIYFFAVLCYSMFLTEYIVMATGKNPFYAVFQSFRYMRKKRCRLLAIQLSFIPKFLLCLTIIPLIYVLPLYCQTTACFANEIIFYSPIYPPASSEDI